MSSCELVTAVTAIACGISKCFPSEELEIIAAVFTQLGDTLATITVANANANNKKNDEQADKNNDVFKF